VEGWAALITAILVGSGSLVGSLVAAIKQVRLGDQQARARIRKLERDLLTAEAVIFRLKSILVRHGLMTQHELEHGDEEAPDAPPTGEHSADDAADDDGVPA
jgi:hypothetical protein